MVKVVRIARARHSMVMWIPMHPIIATRQFDAPMTLPTQTNTHEHHAE